MAVSSMILAVGDFVAQQAPQSGYHGGTGLGHFQIMTFVIAGVFMVISAIVSGVMKSRFRKFQQLTLPVTGADVAQKMLRESGIQDVQVTCVDGFLSDHYNPANKTVNLSHDVYYGNNVSAAAVAAHECGHAVQHARAYHWLTLRSTLVPITQFASGINQWIMIAGIVLVGMGGTPWVLGIGVGLFALTTLFAFVTLPVEFDASKRALQWMGESSIGAHMYRGEARSALFWAAMTYVVAALASLAMLLYYLKMFMQARGRE